MSQLSVIYHNVKNIHNKKVTYNEKDRGPFRIIIENVSNSSEGLYPMDLGKKLHQLDIRVDNNLLFNKQIKTKYLNCYVPQNLIMSKGIIKDISLSVKESDLINFRASNSKILSARRLNIRVKDDDTVKYIP